MVAVGQASGTPLTAASGSTALPAGRPTDLAPAPPTSTPPASQTPTVIPSPTATPPPTSTPTPHPDVVGATIEGLRAREYKGGPIKITNTILVTDAYTRTYITYSSDGLTISGLMHVPFGKGPFPVVILNHGYIPPSQYVTGSDTFRAADILARNGFITISPDLRGYARSGDGLNLYRTGYAIDALNAAASARYLPQADASRVAMWGHSMGAGVTTRAMVISGTIKAFVLYGPVSADIRVRRFMGGLGGVSSGGDPELFESFYYWLTDSRMLDQLSPINYFRYVRAPVQIHIGSADTTTPKEWAQAIRDELNKQGKHVEYYEYPRQGHAFSGASWTLFNQRVVQFLKQQLSR